jgi:uncharacterized repeat protein (TIGR03803 family)
MMRANMGAAASVCLAAGLAGFAHPGQAASVTVLHEFGGPGDGDEPTVGLTELGGKFFGTTISGGANGYGAVFSVTRTGAENVIHSFSSDSAAGGVGLMKAGGLLYGTAGGGAANAGLIYALAPDGTYNIVYTFQGGSDGASPQGALIDVNGTFYGTTASGGGGPCNGGCGTVFSLTPDGTEHVIYAFQGGNDGTSPRAALTLLGGTLYGTTYYGGGDAHCTFGCGTVFAVTPGGAKKILHAFTDRGGEGATPKAPLTRLHGVLYGTTAAGGQHEFGTVFSVSPRGSFTTLYEFGGGGDGKYPEAGLIAVDGVLYGTTSRGGSGQDGGTAFSLTIAGAETVLVAFDGADGYVPVSPLNYASGTFYGTTQLGPGSGGVAFALTP